MKFRFTILLLLFGLASAALAKDIDITFSESTIPYIEKYKNLSVKNSFNNELTRILNTLQCNHKQRKSVKAFWDNFTRVTYKRNDIVSVKIRSNYNCDGTHPYNDIDHSITYDMENNRLVTLYDIFSKKEETYKLIRDNFYKNTKDAVCKEKIKFYLESENLFKEYLAFYMNEKGMVFKLKLPHGLRFCTKDLEISYQDIINKSAYTGVLKKLEKEFKIKVED